MRRKFISALLFGALVTASTSTFVSCKDYDDDINGLQGQITTNASTLEEMVNEKVNNLTTEINTLKSQDAALQTALDQAKTDLNAAIEEAKNAASSAEAAAKAYADVQAEAAKVAAIEAARQSIADAQATLQAGIDDANTKLAELQGKVTTQEEQIAGLLDADNALQASINTANGKIEAAQSTANDALAAAQAAQGTADQNAKTLAEVIANLTTVKEGLDEQISLLGEKVDGVIADVAKNKADVEAKIASVNSLIETNSKAIEALQSKDEELAKLIADNTSNLTALTTQLAEVQAQCEANLTAAKAYTDAKIAELKSALGEDIQKVEGELAAAILRVSSAEEAIKSINETLSNQESINEGVSQGIKDLQDELKDVRQAVEDNMNAITVELGTISGQIEDINGTLANHSQNIETLQNTAASLQSQIDGINTDLGTAVQDIKDLTDKVNGYIASNDEALAALKAELTTNYNQAIAEMGSNLRAEITNSANTLQGNIDKLADVVNSGDTKLQSQIDAIKTQIGAISGDQSVVELIDEKIDAANGRIDKVTEDLNALDAKIQSQLATANEDITDLYLTIERTNETITQVMNLFDYELGSMYNVLSKQLKGLVFNPDMYYQGIEAIGVQSFNYNAIIAGLQKPNLDADQTNDKATNWATKETSVVPIVMASYWLNPSNANVDTATANVKEHFSFIVNNAKYTRAMKQNDITVDSARYANGKRGLLNVYFSMKDANNINSITEDNAVDVMALRYNYSTENGDTTIMSDFAALKQYKIDEFYINKASNGNAGESAAQSGENHLATKAAEAVAHDDKGEYSAPTLEIAYNNTKGINLDEWINVHYDINGETDKYWGDQEEINKKKFKLVYELIGYKAKDADNTNESKHATISKDNVLTVHDVNGETGSRKIIGRTPLVRVTLVDENTNQQVAAVGYIIVKITDVTSKPVIVDDIAAIENGYTVICENNVALNNVKAITWQEVEDKVLGELNMSKEEFENNYSLDVVSGTNNAKQYSYDGKNNSFTEMSDRIGEIVNTEDELGHTTNILKWTVGNVEAYQLFVKQKKTEVSVYVKFTPNSTVSTQRAIYVKLTWAPSTVNAAPTATILDSEKHKSKADWHATNSREEGWKELHIQVGNATVAGATCEYENLTVAKTFNIQPLDIIKNDLGSTYKALADAADVAYRFAALKEQTKTQYVTDNGTYNITVSGDGSTIQAGGSLLATIDAKDGKITIAKNPVSMAIINSYGKNDLANALTLSVEIVPSTCTPANNDKLIVLNNNKLDVKVIKPIFVTDTEVEDMELNNASTLTRNVFLEFEDFNGYDPQTFWDNSMDKVEFWKFYGVTSIKCDETKIETNYTGQWTSVDKSVFTVEYTEPVGDIKLNNMGKVTLNQVNMSRANSFDVRIPLTVTYSWGTLTATVNVHVKAAPGKSTIKRQ